MQFGKRLQRRQKEKERALYVRMPHVIRNQEDVAKLFTGDFKVKLLRQASRYCYVIFSDVEEKMKNLQAAKNLKINDKRVIVASAVIKPKEERKKVVKKKLVIPKIKDTRITKTLFVSNIKCGTKLEELKAAIPGCLSIKMLKPYSQKCRGAMIKMESAQLAAEYLERTRESPVVGGHKLRINPDTRTRHRKPKSSSSLKIYDGDTEIKEIFSKNKKSAPLDHIVLQKDS
ncbi:uncharacterized protein LOC143186622 [Calliopsis andreniformis]|uniref:uncharacterized protein LOC143186622 n=1 Tax=Calliopsis andreniformis TaxID=337506 RepID=UPI003FCDAB69